jgi:D-3-phosphoglycerate dehydrogenase
MSDYLMRGAISNAVNFPSITAEEAPRLRPFIALAEKLGSFAGQLTEAGVRKLTITYEGHVGELKTKALTAAALAGFLRPMLADVNVVSAPVVAKERGIVIDEVLRAAEGDYDSLISVAVETEAGDFALSGAVFNDGKPRIVEIAGTRAEAEFAPSMIYVSNEDKPGFIGRFATLLGEAGVTIATFALGRDAEGGSAVALVGIDGEVPAPVFALTRALPGVKRVKSLKF